MKSFKILVTAGPTREPIDPVRFITNYSTGTMGYAIAAQAKRAGIKVTLISGPTRLKPPMGVKTLYVNTAREMASTVKAQFKKHDCLVMAAAVSDFHPVHYHKKKIKTKAKQHTLALRRNPDILAWAGRHKNKQLVVGFCMETEALEPRARAKMQLKKTDIMVANAISNTATPFGQGATDILLIDSHESVISLTSVRKHRAAGILLDKIINLWYKKQFQTDAHV
jgi:phosphopantothenoylcysteine decarboxylase / phosphopantothenate---cysteine ligase